ncbi:hypothetical protein [Dinghuibacter silviterrae]|uniref:DUF3575 domain-containing protein n=1 Tax=Dinghuibacter silviterrae TaxID=1539049 RepID=A0A4R8DRW7_9BACT|nr:hypothetical protein [Dinghuibacter silviterrae]TDX00974.1 hypothetical protein EDB95_2005 [Dinghuibacter silviterrae]
MKHCLVLCLLALCCTLVLPVAAQSFDDTYQNAVGIHFGWWRGVALSLKHFINDDAALEARASLWKYGGEVCVLYQFYGDVPDIDGLRWYAGGGAHVGQYNLAWAKYNPSELNRWYLGPDGVAGMDYKFQGAPIDMSFDVQPRMYFPVGWVDLWGGIGVRFAF